MAVVYKCDACGAIIENPHVEHMKEFYVNPTSTTGDAFAKPAEQARSIHLCDACFHGLNIIASGGDNPDEAGTPDNTEPTEGE